MSRLGIHIRPGSRNGYGPFTAAKPAVVTAVDEGGALLEARDKSGGYAVTIFRDTSVYLEAPPDFNTHSDMVALARFWYPQLKVKWLQNPAKYYTITNEQGGNDPAVMRRLVDYEREVMRLANADGFKVAVLNLATGTPESLDQWKQIYAPFVVEAWAAGNLYARHVYGGGDLVNGSGSVIPGDPQRPFTELGHLRSLGVSGGIVLTECGLDAGFNFAGITRFVTQMGGYEKLLRPHPEFVGLCGWTLGLWKPTGEDANCQDAMPALTQYLIDNPTPAWTWPAAPPVDPPTPPPSDYPHTRLIAPANLRRDPSTNNPAITPVAVKEGLELIKVGDVTGQPVSGDNRWVKAVAFISRSYATNSTPGKVKTNRNVNLRVVPTTLGNWPLVLLPAGTEFEHLGNIKDLYNDGQWAAVALYIWKPLTADVVPEIRLGKLLPGTLSVTSPLNAPRGYAGDHEGLDFSAPIGTPVFAGANGVVDTIRAVDPGEGYGIYIRVKYSERYKGWFGHLSRVDVTLNQVVTAGQQIGLSGNSGGSTGPHLHLTLQDIPQGVDNFIINDIADPTLYLHPAISLQPSPPEPSTIDMTPYFAPANGSKGDIAILRNNWGQGEERQQLQQEGDSLFVTKNSQYEKRKLRTTTIDLVLDTSPGTGQFYTVQGTWLPRQMAVGQSFTRNEVVRFFRKSDCSPTGAPYGSTSQIKLIARHGTYQPEGGIPVPDVIELAWIIGTRVEERYWYGKHLGLVAWQNAAGRRSWIVERIPLGQQGSNVREQGCFSGIGG